MVSDSWKSQPLCHLRIEFYCRNKEDPESKVHIINNDGHAFFFMAHPLSENLMLGGRHPQSPNIVSR